MLLSRSYPACVSELEISPEMLERHARYARGDADDLGAVVSAAGSMSMTDGAFGVMCVGLVVPAMAVTTATQDMIQDAKGMLEREARALKKSAKEFAEVDETYANGFDRAETGESISGDY